MRRRSALVASDLGAARVSEGKREAAAAHTLCLKVVMRHVFCAAEHFAPVVADGVDACLYAEPPEVPFECAGDVCLAAGCGVSCGCSGCAYLGGRR